MVNLKYKNTSGDWTNIPALEGDQGKVGVVPNISITAQSSDSASVSQSGTPENPSVVLNIPNGVSGTIPNETSLAKKSGNLGSVGGYNTPFVTANALTVNQDSNDNNQVTGAVTITVSNGTSNTEWIKSVMITNPSASVSLGSNWKWSGGEVPTITENSLLVLHWCNDTGVANLIEGGAKIELFSGTFKHSSDYSETGLVLKVLRDGVELFSLGVNEQIECKLANGDEVVSYDPSNSGMGHWPMPSTARGGRIDVTSTGYYLSNLTNGFVIECSARWDSGGSN